MILAEIDEMEASDPESLQRRYVQATVRDAFSRFITRAACRDVLSQFELTLEQFKDCGRAQFGNQRFSEMCHNIDSAYASFSDQLLVVGWGHAPASLMLYEVDASREFDHKLAGIAAIGSGSEVALSNLFLLGQCRDSTLTETLYNVAAAKFASENSRGLGVGRNKVMHVSWKQGEGSKAETPTGKFLLPEQVDQLRSVWEKHGKPRVPDQAIVAGTKISRSLTGAVSLRENLQSISATSRISAETDGASDDPATKPSALRE